MDERKHDLMFDRVDQAEENDPNMAGTEGIFQEGPQLQNIEEKHKGSSTLLEGVTEAENKEDDQKLVEQFEGHHLVAFLGQNNEGAEDGNMGPFQVALERGWAEYYELGRELKRNREQIKTLSRQIESLFELQEPDGEKKLTQLKWKLDFHLEERRTNTQALEKHKGYLLKLFVEEKKWKEQRAQEKRAAERDQQLHNEHLSKLAQNHTEMLVHTRKQHDDILETKKAKIERDEHREKREQAEKTRAADVNLYYQVIRFDLLLFLFIFSVSFWEQIQRNLNKDSICSYFSHFSFSLPLYGTISFSEPLCMTFIALSMVAVFILVVLVQDVKNNILVIIIVTFFFMRDFLVSSVFNALVLLIPFSIDYLLLWFISWWYPLEMKFRDFQWRSVVINLIHLMTTLSVLYLSLAVCSGKLTSCPSEPIQCIQPLVVKLHTLFQWLRDHRHPQTHPHHL